MSESTVFLSYSHDSDEHKNWVLRLATDLRSNGVNTILDQWDLDPGQDIAAFMQKGIVEANRVLLICSETYVSKAEAGVGGVGFERLIVTAEVVQSIETKKFIPILRNNNGDIKVPRFLGPRLYVDFNDDAYYTRKLEELLRELLNVPSKVKPPLGQNPFSGEASRVPQAPRVTSSTGVTINGQSIVSDVWFENERMIAEKGISALGLTGLMELRFALHEGQNKSQLDLLNAVRKSQILTFGWSIGVTLDNRDEFRPRPYGDGIRAEISIPKDVIFSGKSYDYWAVRKNGDFYLLQNLFEDSHGENLIFFNTRIVRVTESLLFASNLYSNLGTPPDVRVSIRVTHRGLAGRSLTSVGTRRLRMVRKCIESNCEAEIVVTLGKIRETLVDNVRQLLEPLFMLFEFQRFEESVYSDIVRRFEKGEVS